MGADRAPTPYIVQLGARVEVFFALMTFMSDDCVFETSSGPEACGTRHAGRERVREAFTRVFTIFPGATFGDARHFVAGNRGVSEWVFTGTTVDGKKLEVKSAYFKNRTA